MQGKQNRNNTFLPMKKTLILLASLAICTLAGAQNVEKRTADDSQPIYTHVDTPPEFPGGMEKMYQFIAANIQFPGNQDTQCEGRVLVTFVVERDGRVTEAQVAQDPCPGAGYGEEALRVVNLMPKWKPGRQGNEKVRVRFNLPVKFSAK